MSKSGWLNDFEAEKDELFNDNLAFNAENKLFTPASIAVKNDTFCIYNPFIYELCQLIKTLCEFD